MNEFALIEKYFAPLAGEGSLTLKDDAAFITPPPGRTLVVTQDAIAEGVHYIGDEAPGLIAQKLVRVNLSDLAAKGAEPWGGFLSLILPPHADEAWVGDFAKGLAEDFTRFGLMLFGGDTVKGKGPAGFSLTAIGLVPGDRTLLRSGARAGDLLCVTGTLGDAALGLIAARGGLPGLNAVDKSFLTDRYRLPQPRLEYGRMLRSHARAAMDISDGLIQDAGHLAHASGTGIEIELSKLPLSPAALAAFSLDPTLADLPLYGGDDYELLVALPPNALPLFGEGRLRVIGRMVEGAGVVLLDLAGSPVKPLKNGWRHL